jgi:hypothetical protein
MQLNNFKFSITSSLIAIRGFAGLAHVSIILEFPSLKKEIAKEVKLSD